MKMHDDLSAWEKYKAKLGESRPWDALDPKKYVDQTTASTRFDICKQCPKLIKATSQCKECGCFMAVKTKLNNANCPIGKW